jgi:hypothetical protein
MPAPLTGAESEPWTAGTKPDDTGPFRTGSQRLRAGRGFRVSVYELNSAPNHANRAFRLETAAA